MAESEWKTGSVEDVKELGQVVGRIIYDVYTEITESRK